MLQRSVYIWSQSWSIHFMRHSEDLPTSCSTSLALLQLLQPRAAKAAEISGAEQMISPWATSFQQVDRVSSQSNPGGMMVAVLAHLHPKTHHSDCDPWSREVKPSSQRAPLWFHRGKDLLCYEFIALVMLKQPSLCPSELSIWYLAPADPIFQWHCGKLFKISLIFCLKLVAETAACQEKQRAGSKTKSWRLFPCNNLSTICASQMSVLHPTITATSPWGSFTWPFVGDPCGGALVGALSAAKASATLVAEHITCKGSSPQNLQVLLKAAKHKRSACQKTLCMHTNNRYIGNWSLVWLEELSKKSAFGTCLVSNAIKETAGPLPIWSVKQGRQWDIKSSKSTNTVLKMLFKPTLC